MVSVREGALEAFYTGLDAGRARISSDMLCSDTRALLCIRDMAGANCGQREVHEAAATTSRPANGFVKEVGRGLHPTVAA